MVTHPCTNGAQFIESTTLKLPTHKYVDDTTASETVAKTETSQLQTVTDTLVSWSAANHMNNNEKKTKEMIIGSLRGQQTPLLISGQVVKQVSVFKLLGVTSNNPLRWSDHIEPITSWANKRLWFLKKVKRAGVSQKDLVHYYEAVIRPVLEYASPVWHKSHSRPDKDS